MSYNGKHNEANSEAEPRRQRRQPQLELRDRRARRTTRPWRRCGAGRSRTSSPSLFISQGTPMLLMGDEVRQDPAGQQQRLLPGQRARLVRLGCSRQGTRAC
ncbi:MAG: hypothetical protein M0C28_31580 [Candidatus Moduliflexus flocculans]|nr:hypothetical protein [Candidatus Moduliflexus flocculans]